jgi:hypothetical protein
MNMHQGRAIAAFLAILGVAGTAPAAQYKVKTEGGVTVITNGKKPDPPKGAPTRLVLEEIYSIGGGDQPDDRVDISAWTSSRTGRCPRHERQPGQGL